MKIFKYAIIVAFLFCMQINAQNGTLTKSSMIVLVGTANKTFNNEATYETWLQNQIGTLKLNPQENNFMKDVFHFVSSKSSPEFIFKNYDGKSLFELVKSKNDNQLSSFVNSNLSRCGWLCQLWNSIKDLLSPNDPVFPDDIYDNP